MLRTDLIELGIDALMALANPGFVKRAQKDVAAGALPGLEQDDDGTVHARFDDGVHTSMAAGVSLRDADCSCVAGGMCRHRVMLVLAYQARHAGDLGADAAPPAATSARPWSPASFDDAAIAAAVTPQVLEAARKLALARPVAKVTMGGAPATVPTAVLPMSQVRFFSSASLAHARCDCQQGLACAHVVLACWAFRQAEQTHPGAAEATLALAPFGAGVQDAPGGPMDTETAARVRQQLHDWLWSLWREGAAQPLLGLEARYQALAAELAQLGWTWVREDLETIWQIMGALARRSNRYDMGDLVRAGARLHARLQGAAHADTAPVPRLPASQILGIGQQGEVALDLLRLVSLGMRCWREDGGGVGASIVFADPDTQAACVLERSWPEADGDAQDLPNRRIAGMPLTTLAAGQVVTRAARRRANASLELGTNRQQTSVLALSPRAWEDLRAPLRFDALGALLAHLRSRPPAGLRPGDAAGDWHVVDLACLVLDGWAWDPVRQTLSARWTDADGLPLRAALPHQALTPGAVDALARALAGEWGGLRALAGPAWREEGGVAIRPMTVMTAQRAVVLALEPRAPHPTPLRETPLADDPAQQLLQAASELLAQLMRQGLRHLPPALHARVQAQAAQLDQAGYGQAARLLRLALSDGESGPRLAALSGLGTLLDMLRS